MWRKQSEDTVERVRLDLQGDDEMCRKMSGEVKTEELKKCNKHIIKQQQPLHGSTATVKSKRKEEEIVAMKQIT